MSKILERLVEQASGEGADILTLRALVEEAAEAGVRRALAQTTPTRSAKTPESGLVLWMVAWPPQAMRPKDANTGREDSDE